MSSDDLSKLYDRVLQNEIKVLGDDDERVKKAKEEERERLPMKKLAKHVLVRAGDEK